MSLEIFHQDEYKLLTQEHIRNTIDFLLDHSTEFGISCETRHIDFDPSLPRELMDSLEGVALFILGGYTFESAYITEDSLHFEAGFGDESFGSLLSIPLLAIKQIYYETYPIAINITEPIRPNPVISTERSMSALLSKPENKRLLKRD